MIKPKGLDMAKIEKIFNANFTFNKNDLNKGVTFWTLTPKRQGDDAPGGQDKKCS